MPVAWSPDGARLLLYQRHAAGQRFVISSLAGGNTQGLSYLAGSILYATFGGNDEVFVHLEEHGPAGVVALDVATGQLKGTVLSGGVAPTGATLDIGHVFLL